MDIHCRVIFYEKHLLSIKRITFCDWTFLTCLINRIQKKLNQLIFSGLLTNDLSWKIYQSFDAAGNDLHFKSKMINDKNGSTYSPSSILWRNRKAKYLTVMQDFQSDLQSKPAMQNLFALEMIIHIDTFKKILFNLCDWNVYGQALYF